MMAGGLGGGAAGGGGPSGPAFEDTHDFSSSITYDIPGESNDSDTIWEIQNDSGSNASGAEWDISSSGENVEIRAASDWPDGDSIYVGPLPQGGVMRTISRTNEDAEIQTIIRAYDL